jgi:NADPH-dependent 2,4-dienoyl-CoA reductase/sulfur reductase-like enzyme
MYTFERNKNQIYKAYTSLYTDLKQTNKPQSHAGYYPGSQTIWFKLIFSPEDGKIFGAQAVGMDLVEKRIDVVATAMLGKMTVHDLAEVGLDFWCLCVCVCTYVST